MKRALAILTAACLAWPACAQEAALAPGVILRGLDKVSGQTTDMKIPANGVVRFGRLRIRLRECRFPAGNRAGDAYAGLEITELGESTPRFEGWMIASSPALSAMDHPRYDVWVIRCTSA